MGTTCDQSGLTHFLNWYLYWSFWRNGIFSPGSLQPPSSNCFLKRSGSWLYDTQLLFTTKALTHSQTKSNLPWILADQLSLSEQWLRCWVSHCWLGPCGLVLNLCSLKLLTSTCRCQQDGDRMWRFQRGSPQHSWFIVTAFMVDHDGYSMWGSVFWGVCHQPPRHTGRCGSLQNAMEMELQMPPVSPIPSDNVHIQLGPKVLVLVSWDKRWSQ